MRRMLLLTVVAILTLLHPSLASAQNQKIAENGVVNAAQFTAGSSSCGLIEAYAAVPATGGAISLASDCTMSSATLNLVPGKSIWLQGNGHTINCTTPEGAFCLTFLTSATMHDNMMPRLTLRDVTFDGTNAKGGGVIFTGKTYGMLLGEVQRVSFKNFTSITSMPLRLNWSEDLHFSSVAFNNNCNDLDILNNSNQIQFDSLWINFGARNPECVPIHIQNSYAIAFNSCLVQNNPTRHSIVMDSNATSQVSMVTFSHCDMEGNGDGTDASRLIVFGTTDQSWIMTIAFRSSLLTEEKGALFSMPKGKNINGIIMDNNNTYSAVFADETFTGRVPFHGRSENDHIKAGSRPFYAEWDDINDGRREGEFMGSINPATTSRSNPVQYGYMPNLGVNQHVERGLGISHTAGAEFLEMYNRNATGAGSMKAGINGSTSMMQYENGSVGPTGTFRLYGLTGQGCATAIIQADGKVVRGAPVPCPK